MTEATTQPADRPARDLGIHWFQSILAERLLHAGQMAQNTAMMRRGGLKMQDGTLGQPGNPEEPEDMNIQVGNETHNHYAAPEKPEPAALPSASGAAMTLGKMALVAALAGTGVGVAGPAVAWLLGAFDKPEPPAVTIPVDNNDTRAFQFR